VDCASAAAARERAASEPVQVRLEVAHKCLPLLGKFREEPFEKRSMDILGGGPEAALTVTADFDQVLQDLSFCAFGHDTLLREPSPKSGSITACTLCASHS
jgi:hypothetical protein